MNSSLNQTLSETDNNCVSISFCIFHIQEIFMFDRNGVNVTITSALSLQ